MIVITKASPRLLVAMVSVLALLCISGINGQFRSRDSDISTGGAALSSVINDIDTDQRDLQTLVTYQYVMTNTYKISDYYVNGPTTAEVDDMIRYTQIFYVRHISALFGQSYFSVSATNSGPTLVSGTSITVTFLLTLNFQLAPGLPSESQARDAVMNIDKAIYLSDFVNRAFPSDNFVDAIAVDIVAVSLSTPSPTKAPTTSPTSFPTAGPTSFPTAGPTKLPTAAPTKGDSMAPSLSRLPSLSPSKMPSSMPSFVPSTNPSTKPSALASEAPSLSLQPSMGPSLSANPSSNPSSMPSLSLQPSQGPSSVPTTQPTMRPSLSSNPSSMPSLAPSSVSSQVPSNQPSAVPTSRPTKTSDFLMDINFSSNPTTLVPTNDQTIITQNLFRLQSVIIGDLPDVENTVTSDEDCTDPIPSSIVNVYICYTYNQDLAGTQTLGVSTVFLTRGTGDSGTTYLAKVRLNPDFADDTTPNGAKLFKLATEHLTLLALGIGLSWSASGLVNNPGLETCTYRADSKAGEEFRKITNCPDDKDIPLSLDSTSDTPSCNHWSQSCFGGGLLMNPILDGNEVLTSITLGSLEDLGYTVDYAQAEPITDENFSSECKCGADVGLTSSSEFSYQLTLSSVERANAETSVQALLAQETWDAAIQRDETKSAALVKDEFGNLHSIIL